jgi:hypothetical protein
VVDEIIMAFSIAGFLLSSYCLNVQVALIILGFLAGNPLRILSFVASLVFNFERKWNGGTDKDVKEPYSCKNRFLRDKLMKDNEYGRMSSFTCPRINL